MDRIEPIATEPKGRMGVHAVPHRPVRGNWIWLASGILAVTALTVAALHYGRALGPPASARGAAAGAAAGHPGAVPRPDSPRGSQSAGALGRKSTAAAPASPGTGRSGWAGLAPRGLAAVAWMTRGVALFYNPAGAPGGCSLGPLRARGWYVRLPAQQYANSAACGSYLVVRGPRGWVRAEVAGLCHRCAASVISLSPAAFSRVAGRARASARVAFWRAVSPPLRRAIVVRAATTAAGHPAVQVLHTGNPLAAVAIRPASATAGRWLALRLNGHDFWVAAGPVGRGPFAVRIADDRGHQVTLASVALAPGTMTRTRVLMYR